MTPFLSFNYLYRDASNYKNHGSVVFSNPKHRSVEEVTSIIRSNLLDGEWFLHAPWNIPDLFFEETNEEQDHPLHEFVSVTPCENPRTEVGSIEDFLFLLPTSHHSPA